MLQRERDVSHCPVGGFLYHPGGAELVRSDHEAFFISHLTLAVHQLVGMYGISSDPPWVRMWGADNTIVLRCWVNGFSVVIIFRVLWPMATLSPHPLSIFFLLILSPYSSVWAIMLYSTLHKKEEREKRLENRNKYLQPTAASKFLIMLWSTATLSPHPLSPYPSVCCCIT